MKVLMVSLGCDKNRVDSEMMMGTLAASGYDITENEEEADVIIVNTCCFIGDAKKESINAIFEMAQLKETGSLKTLIVAGCLGVRYRDEILEQIPEIDAIVGITSEDKIADVLEETLKGLRVDEHTDISSNPVWKHDRIVNTGSVSSYLKIAEGCDKNCTYCVIPKVRGHYRSYPMEDLVEQARKLVQNGVRELILVAQETTLYGTDLYGEKSLHKLLEALCRIEDLHWIRILYAYPEEIYPEMLEVMAKEPKICHYLDMPIQHASDHILKKMNRRTDRQDLIRIVNEVRSTIPDVVLRTTLLTGFPGETEEDVDDLQSFIEEMKFDRLGVFAYSREEDTPAAKFKDQVPQRIKNKRRDRLMLTQQKISAENGRKRVGSLMETIVEGYLPEEDVYVGRSYGDAPDVDGYIFFESEREWMSGDFVMIRITDSREYDLQGVPEDEFTE